MWGSALSVLGSPGTSSRGLVGELGTVAGHDKGRFGERNFCCLLEPWGTVGWPEVLWGTARCQGGRTKLLCSDVVHGGQPRGWDGESTAGPSARLQGWGREPWDTLAGGGTGKEMTRLCSSPASAALVPSNYMLCSKVTLHVRIPVGRWLSLLAPGAFPVRGGGCGCPLVGGTPRSWCPLTPGAQQTTTRTTRRRCCRNGWGRWGRTITQWPGRCRRSPGEAGGALGAVRGSQSSTPLPDQGCCQEESAARQSWADSAVRHAWTAPSLCVPSERG